MAQYSSSESHLAFPSAPEAVGILVPKVENLLRRFCHEELLSAADGESGVTITAPISFPDGIGNGAVKAELFRYRDSVRLDIHLDHDRMFAKRGGAPSERRCFMNDYVASITLADGTDDLPQKFTRKVVSGVAAARDAVRRHNRQSRGVWDEVKVAARD
jgi:hypothetical protein